LAVWQVNLDPLFEGCKYSINTMEEYTLSGHRSNFCLCFLFLLPICVIILKLLLLKSTNSLLRTTKQDTGPEAWPLLSSPHQVLKAVLSFRI
jgi:hypothetical protein